MSSFIIGVAGGSGSGKSTVTSHIVKSVGQDKVTVIEQDNYYKNLSHLTMAERVKVNFDHPDAFDWDLLKQHIYSLNNGIEVETPLYDFASYVRLDHGVTLLPSQVIVFEGIFALMDDELNDLMSLKIFVDTAPDIRFIRRLERDIAQRGRTTQSVIDQYSDYVRPMHKRFVEPTKRNSHIIIPHGANTAALEMIAARIKDVLNTTVEC